MCKKTITLISTAVLSAILCYPATADQIIGYQPKQPEEPAAVQPSQQPAQELPAQDQPDQGQEAQEQPQENIPVDETTTEDEFIAPDTYPAYLAPQYARELENGISFLESEDETHVMIVGFRGDAAYGGRVEIPSDIGGLPVTEIAEYAFAGNEAIRSLTIPDSVKTIGEYAASRCINLETVVLPESMTDIPAGMFEGCRSIKNLTFSSSLVSIGDLAFSGCSSLSRLKIPATLTKIGVDSFAACERLIFDCSENSFAAGYAEVNGIETTGSETWGEMVIKMAAATIILCIVVFAGPKIIRKITKRNSKKVG